MKFQTFKSYVLAAIQNPNDPAVLGEYDALQIWAKHHGLLTNNALTTAQFDSFISSPDAQLSTIGVTLLSPLQAPPPSAQSWLQGSWDVGGAQIPKVAVLGGGAVVLALLFARPT